ncbi:exported hypothetical protein [Candidatus Terasakiella magnetica]|uniref:Uncharacterized protein n=1 Tax=Candidatus Terasakiella magnetica TaxID=1867952 RepID=A0A1C3RD66_9PROT|nr:hypothetical protein [Candidatus Terasakiella magnetica]SCA55216.1 exported hypothetical protein [Candidatus Terasakiella magnetica]
MARLLLLLCLSLLPLKAHATDFCDMDTMLASYKAAFNRQKLGDLESAHNSFKKLAKAAVAPAQRHVAQYFLEESRADMALENAIMWAQLAAWGGDEKAKTILKQAVESARHSVSEAGLRWAAQWRPEDTSCFVGEAAKIDDDDFQIVGRFPVVRHENVDEEVFAAMVTRLSQALENVTKVAVYFTPLIDLIPAFEVIEGEGTDRFIQWDADNDWIKVSSGFLQDSSPRQLAYSLVLTVQRRLFSLIKDASFADQVGTHYGKIKIYGSLYGDVRTKRFLKLFKEAIKEVRKLPVVLRDKVNYLDEIHYMPPSRYHAIRLASTKRFALYDHVRSGPEKRMMIVAQKMAFEEVDQIILELVRVGHQAQQHTYIEGMRGQVDGKKRENAILKALEGDMQGVAEAFTKTTAKKKKEVAHWDKAGPDGIAKLYCESVNAQVKAAIALKIHENRFSRTVDLKNCKKARAAWRTYRSTETKK